MALHALHQYPNASELPRWLLAGMLSGAVSVLVFEQAALRLLGLLGLGDGLLLWPLVVWGGAWGVLLAAALGRLSGKRLILAAAALGATVPTLVALVLIAPLHGQPAVTGVVPLAILVAGVVNGAWGLGTGTGLALFGRR
jgi:hypothetical protein